MRNSAITSLYTSGTLNETKNTFDLAIEGKGFFMVQTPDGGTAYTRNGSFQMAIGENSLVLATSDGNPVLSSTGQPIVLDRSYSANEIMIDDSGNLGYPDENNNIQPIGIRIGVAQFNNPSGLSKAADSLLKETDASGTPVVDEAELKYRIKQGFLESSNVQAVDEMVSLIVAQRAYEMNSRIVKASDEMMQQANNLR